MKKIISLFVIIFALYQINAQENNYQATISVSGEGIVKIIPDEAIVRIRVEHKGSSAIEVKQSNDKVIDEVLKRCKKMKIDKKDVLSERIYLNKNYDYNRKKYEYVATQSLRIYLRDLSKYEKLMPELLNSGINRIDGVNFQSSKIEDYKAQARLKAVENAKMKAEAYAGVLDQKIGKAISISENQSAVQPFPLQRFALEKASADFSANNAETIAVGEINVTAKIAIIFELK